MSSIASTSDLSSVLRRSYEGAEPAPKFKRGFDQFFVVVNVPLKVDPEKDSQNLERIFNQIQHCCASLRDFSSKKRQFHVIVGMNVGMWQGWPSSTEENKKAGKLQSLCRRCNDIVLKSKAKPQFTALRNSKYYSIEWTHFIWKPVVREQGNFIDYVGIRNHLFESESTQKAIARYIEQSAKASSASVKALFLDPDTRICDDGLVSLNGMWQKNSPALINTLFYRFVVTNPDCKEQRAGRIKRAIEKASYWDRCARMSFAESKIKIPLRYLAFITDKSGYLEAPQQSLENNICFLRQLRFKYRITKEDKSNLDTLLGLYNRFTDFVEKRPVPKGQPTWKCISYIYVQVMEKRLRHLLDNSVNFIVRGKDILYPPEPAIALSLYEKAGVQETSLFDVYKQEKEAVKRSGGRIRLWGDSCGAGEGQQLFMQVMRLSQKSLKLKDRVILDYSGSCLTERPLRFIEDESNHKLSEDELLTKYLEKTPQSFFGRGFIEQRECFVRGTSVRFLGEGRSEEGYSPIPRFIRERVVDALPQQVIDVRKQVRFWTRVEPVVHSELKRVLGRTPPFEDKERLSKIVDNILFQYVFPLPLGKP